MEKAETERDPSYLQRKRMEDTLRRERDVLDWIMETSPAGITVVNREGQIAFANAQAERVLGLTKAEITHRAYNDPEWRITDYDGGPFPDEQLPFRQVMATGQPVSAVRHAIEWPDGRRVLLLINAAPLLDEAGRVDGMVATLEDVTERNRAREALRRSLEETARSQRLLLALSQAAQAVQRARTPEAVYQAIGEQMTQLGFDATLFALSDDQKQLIVVHLTLKSELVRIAEKLTGLSVEGYRFPLVPGGFFQRIVAGRETVFSHLDARPFAEALPRPVRRLAGRVADLVGWQQNIIAPLIIGGEVRGLLVVTGTDLTESDVPAITAFANQAAIAIENARLYRETQHLAAFNESIVQSIAEGIAVQDADGFFTFVNPAVAGMMGYAPDELVGLHWTAIIPPDQQPIVRAADERRTHGESDRYQLELVHRDGRRIPVLIAGSPRPDEKGGFTGSMAVLTDITERVRAEEALRESEARFRSVVESSPMGMHMYHLESDDRLVFVGANRAADQILGVDNSQFIGKTIEEAFPPLVATEVPERYRRAAAEGESWVTEQIDYEDEKIAGAFEVHAFQTEPGRMVALFLDITHRKQAEEAQRRHTQQLEALRRASLALGGTLETDRVLSQLLEQVGQVVPYDCANVMQIEDGVARVTHQRGYERLGVAEAMAALRLPVDEVPHLRQMLATRHPCAIADTQTDPDWVRLEPVRWIHSWIGTPIVVADQVVGFFSLDSGTPGFYHSEHADLLAAFAAHAAAAIRNAMLYEDLQRRMEELQRTQAQLIQSAKMAAIGELAASVAHELNNPLQAVLGFSELLLWNRSLDDVAQEDLATVVAEARRAGDIVRRLLDFTRQTESFFEQADVNQVVQETLVLVRQQLESNHVSLEETYAADLPFLSLAVGRMKQVFLNLVMNALYAMPQGGRLTVISEQVGDEVTVRIADTGVGIAADHLPRIFEPFFTTKPVGRGTGLGLSVSLGIVQEHDGRITVESQEGKGSAFTVWLPVTAAREVQGA